VFEFRKYGLFKVFAKHHSKGTLSKLEPLPKLFKFEATEQIKRRALISLSDVVVTLLFVILGVAVLGWVGILIPELRAYLKQNKFLAGIFSMLFAANATNADVKKTYRPLKFTLEDILPIVFWLLILLPMILFPVILVIGPILHIPWTTLFPMPPP
jgi:hypothetical protein